MRGSLELLVLLIGILVEEKQNGDPLMRRLNRLLILPIAGIALLSLSCASQGSLGQSQSNAQCSPSDFVCVAQGLNKPLAAGTTLPVDVTLDLQGSATPPITLVSGDETVLTVDGSTIKGEGPGLAALLITIPGNLVVDFFHIWVEQPTAIVLHERTYDGSDAGPVGESIELLVGDELNLSVEPFKGSQRLLGEPEATWTSDSPAIQVLTDGPKGRRRIIAKAEGKATIHAEAFGASADLALEVLP